MKQSPEEANSHSASQQIPRLVRSPKVRYRVPKDLQHSINPNYIYSDL